MLRPVPTVSLLALLLAPIAAQAQPASQGPTQAELQQRRAAKMAKAVFQKVAWSFDFDAAKAQAVKDRKAILAYFTISSNENKLCDALEAGLLASPEFVEVGKDFVPFVSVMSRVEGEKYPRLLHQLGLATLPTLAFLDPEGNLITVLRKHELPPLVSTAADVRALLAAKAAVAANGGKAAAKDLFLAEFRLGRLDADQAKARLSNVELSSTERAAIDPQLVDLEIAALHRRTTDANRAQLAAQVYEMHKAGRQPTEVAGFQFWGFLLQHAAKSHDGALADQAYAELERRQSKTKDMLQILAAHEQWKRLVAEAKQQR